MDRRGRAGEDEEKARLLESGWRKFGSLGWEDPDDADYPPTIYSLEEAFALHTTRARTPSAS